MFHQYFLHAESSVSEAIKTLKIKWWHLKNIEEVDVVTLKTMKGIISLNPVDGRNLINRLFILLTKAHEYSQGKDKKNEKTPEGNPKAQRSYPEGNPQAQMCYMNALITSLIKFYKARYKNKYVNLGFYPNLKDHQKNPVISMINFH